MADSTLFRTDCARSGFRFRVPCAYVPEREEFRPKPSWYLLTTDNRMIPPDGQRAMVAHAGARVTEVAGSHAVFVSKPEAVAALIEQAAEV